MVTRHNQLRDVFVDFCHQAHLGVQVEVRSTLTPDGSQSRPADVLVRDWIAGRFAAFDFTVSSPLSITSLDQACTTSGSTAQAAEVCKHRAYGPKCSELHVGWVCVPLAVETYGNWGKEAKDTFSHLVTRLAIGSHKSKSSHVFESYSKLKPHLDQVHRESNYGADSYSLNYFNCRCIILIHSFFKVMCNVLSCIGGSYNYYKEVKCYY